jgi:aryl-alcohol dehydrogenase-like predicted oxidoreductase
VGCGFAWLAGRGTVHDAAVADPFPTPSSFTFGCMSLGWGPERLREDVRVARAAMDAGLWFHASQEYAGGGAFMALRHAFDESPARRPELILKIRCDSAEHIVFDVEDALRRLGVARIAIAQLCRAKHDRRPIVDDFLAQGPMWNACERLRREGKVGAFALEIFASFSADALRAVRAGMFPAYIFYLNPGERQASDELMDLLEARGERLLSLRTLCGGDLDPSRIEALRAKEPANAAIARFDELRPIYERSGCASWPEFSMAFLRSLPRLLTTIAGTSSAAHLDALLAADRRAKPMAPELTAEIRALHRRWGPP